VTLFEKLIVTQLVKEYPAFFMEPEGSLPCSQKPTTGPYTHKTILPVVLCGLKLGVSL
jgi:hypothetical protein